MKKKRKKLMDGGYTDPYVQGANTISSSLISLSASLDAKKAAEKQALLAQRNDLNGRKAQDLMDSEEFEPEGYPLDTYYKKGGTIPSGVQYAKGGSVKSLSSDGAVMKGRSHEEGGIEIADGIEVEGDEAIKDNKVFSDTLKHRSGKTYADIAKSLMTKKGKLEDKLKSGNTLKSNTAKRQIEILDSKEDRLFEEQEASKEGMDENKKMALGGVIRDTMPYVDNITNALLTLNTPKVAQPSYIKPRKMQTEININDKVGEVNQAVASSNRFIEGNTTNSTAARNAITVSNLKGVEAKGRIAAQKDNIESQLKNQDAQNRTRVDAINAGKTDQYNAMQTARQGAIQSRISANAANLADDYIESRNFNETQQYNDEELSALKAMYNPGVVGRTEARQQEILAELRKKRQLRNTK